MLFVILIKNTTRTRVYVNVFRSHVICVIADVRLRWFGEKLKFGISSLRRLRCVVLDNQHSYDSVKLNDYFAWLDSRLHHQVSPSQSQARWRVDLNSAIFASEAHGSYDICYTLQQCMVNQLCFSSTDVKKTCMKLMLRWFNSGEFLASDDVSCLFWSQVLSFIWWMFFLSTQW